MAIRIAAAVLAGYLLGSVSNSIVISRMLYKRDVRKAGSGNAGATNMARNFGMGAGILTLALDVLKGILACLIGQWLQGDWGVLAAGLACDVGHCLPLFFGFKGGKGVSVGTAVAIFLGWKVLLIAAAAFALGFVLTKRVSVGSLSAAVALPIAAFLLLSSLPLSLLALAAGLLVIIRHVPNVKRLLKGEEPEVKAAKR